MKKMLCNLCRPLFVALFAVTVFAACDSDTTVSPDDGSDKEKLPKLTLTSGEITGTSFVVEWTKMENVAVYAYTISEGTAVDAEAEILYTANSKVLFSKLKGETAYTVQVKAVAAKDDKTYTDSDFADIKVTTTVASAEDQPFTFEVKVVVPNASTIKVIPANKSAIYILVNASKAAVEASGIDDYLQNYIDMNCFWIEDWTKPTGIALWQGDTTLESSALYPERDYMLIGATVNHLGEVQKYSTQAYKTPAIEAITCTFDVTIKNLTYNSTEFSIIPSDKDVNYVYELIPTDKYNGKTDEQIIKIMLETTGSFYSKGDIIDQGQSYLDSNTEYGIYVVGAVNQRPTTGLTVKKFTTKKVEFDFSSDAYTEVAILSIKENIIDGVGSGFVEVKAKLAPNEATYRYQPICAPESEFAGMSDEEIARYAQEKGESSEWYLENLWTWKYAPSVRPIPVDTDCMIVVLSKDTDSKFGKLTKFKFRTTLSNGGGGGDEQPPVVPPTPEL